MRNTAFFVAGFLLLMLQSVLFRLVDAVLHFAAFVTNHSEEISMSGLVPSLLLPLIVFMGVHEYSLARGAGVAFALGYLSDLIGISPIGLNASIFVAIFVLARAAGVRLAAQTMLTQVGLALAFTLLHDLMTLVLIAIFGGDAYVPRTLYPASFPHVAVTALASPFVFRVAQRIHSATMARTPEKVR